MTTNAERLSKSEAASTNAWAAIEEADIGPAVPAMIELMAAISILRGVVRIQQAQIDRLLAALPSAEKES